MLPIDLQPASFKGAPFLVPSDEVEEGRNAVTHEYPDASFRYVEDNGLIPPKFSISALLHGADLPAKLNRLRSALNSPGPGLLKHPYYGAQFVQVDGCYRVRREDKQAGVIELEIKFAVTGAPVLPGIVSGIAAVVTGLATSALTTMFSAFTAAYGSPRAAGTLSRAATAIATFAATLSQSFSSAGDGPVRLMANAGKFARNIADAELILFEAFRAPFDDDTIPSRDLVLGFAAAGTVAAEIADEASAISASTVDLAIRRSALMVLGATLQAASFVCLADAMAGTTYATAEEVESDEDRLTEAFSQVQGRELDASVHEDLVSIHTAASEVLRDATVRLPRLTSIDTSPIPASVLAYSLYESDASTFTIVNLNLDRDPVLMFGPVSALTVTG